MIETIFFDADDTLYPEKHLKIRAELETAELISKETGIDLRMVWEAFYGSKWEALKAVDNTPYINSRENWYKKTLKKLKITKLTSFELADYYWDVINKHIEPYYDVALALPKLAMKYDLYILTDEYIDIINRKLASMGFDKYFKDTISGEHVNVQKPNSELFKLALEKAEADVNTTLMIGDNPRKDIRGANALGMKTALLKRGHYYRPKLPAEKPDIFIENYIELEKQIQSL